MRIFVPHQDFDNERGHKYKLHHPKRFYLRGIAVVALHAVWGNWRRIGECALKLPWPKFYPADLLWLHDRLIFASLLLLSAHMPDLYWHVLDGLFEYKHVFHAAAWSHLEILLLTDSYSDHRLFIPGYATESIKSGKKDDSSRDSITKKNGNFLLRRELLIKSNAVEWWGMVSI